MQEKITIDAARVFSAGFFRDLVRYGIVDLACTQARRQLKRTQHGSEAHIPALFMAVRTGELNKPHPVYGAVQKMLAGDDLAWFSRSDGGYLEMPITVVPISPHTVGARSGP
jgi:hypothetical protein